MDALPLYLVAAIVGGVVAALLRLPPLIGFLAAGFALAAGGVSESPLLDILADLGVTILLFAVGLKLDLRLILTRPVWLTSVVHMAGSTLAGGLLVLLLASTGLLAVALPTGLGGGHAVSSALLVGLALAFSSTVVVVKLLEERSDTLAFYGRVAVGILVVQDLAAVLFLAATKGMLPSPWALALVLLIPAVRLVRPLWNRLGHGELQALFGVTVALVPGYALFELVGLKGDLGALVMGVLLASHPRSPELSRQLFTLKELLLVAFFLSIGLGGVPTPAQTLLGLALLLLLPLQAVLYAAMLSATGLRHRSSVLATLSLTNFSEFGLIVVAVEVEAGLLDETWLPVVAVAVAASFIVSAALARNAGDLAERIAARLPEQSVDRLVPACRPVDVGHAEALVLGLGRVGSATYRQLVAEGLEVVGVEHDPERVRALVADGLDVVEADATDDGFWRRVVDVSQVRLVALAMPFHGSNMSALEELRRCGFTGTVTAVAFYEDELAEIRAAGADSVVHLYSGSGTALAEAGLTALEGR